jgi:hypothetical protein
MCDLASFLEAIMATDPVQLHLMAYNLRFASSWRHASA